MILERYILRNYIGPFIFSLSIITFIFVMDFVLRYIDLFLNKGVAFLVVLQTFILSLGHMFALIIPMAVLPATLMTFGNLASENEITAMRSSGVSLYRMILPGVVVGALLTVFMMYFNNTILPETNHKLLNLLIDINKKKPTVEIKENVFIDAFAGYTIYVRHKNDKTGELRDVQIFKHNKPGQLPTTITAERGHLAYLMGDNVLRFELENGEIHEMPEGNDPTTYRKTTFKTYVINITDVDRSLKRSQREYRGDREMNTRQMREKIAKIRGDITAVDRKMADMASSHVKGVFRLLNEEYRDSLANARGDTMAAMTTNVPPGAAALPASVREKLQTPRPKAPPQNAFAKQNRRASVTLGALRSQREIKESYLRQINRYEVEIHKKFSLSFACIIFVLIGSPIAIRLGRTGMNMAVALSILVFLVYYICLIGGEKLADRRFVNPFIAMWVPNIIFGVASIFLIHRASRETSTLPFDWRRLHPLRILAKK